MSSPVTASAASCLSTQELAEIARLRVTDQRVRAHEQAHLATAGQYARGGASFQYVTGPDNVRYAVAGEVSVDVSPVSGDPQATIDKMRTIMTAATAPAYPSSQDRQVAAAAARELGVAQLELARQAYTGNGQSRGSLIDLQA